MRRFDNVFCDYGTLSSSSLPFLFVKIEQSCSFHSQTINIFVVKEQTNSIKYLQRFSPKTCSSFVADVIALQISSLCVFCFRTIYLPWCHIWHKTTLNKQLIYFDCGICSMNQHPLNSTVLHSKVITNIQCLIVIFLKDNSSWRERLVQMGFVVSSVCLWISWSVYMLGPTSHFCLFLQQWDKTDKEIEVCYRSDRILWDLPQLFYVFVL